MKDFLLYILRSGLYLGVFYAFYLLVMRRTTFFRLNRVVLLAGSMLCALLPLLRVRSAQLFVGAGPLSITAVGEASQTGVPTGGSLEWDQILGILYLVGLLVVLSITLICAFKMHRITAGKESTQVNGFRTVMLGNGNPSFSFVKTIFICPQDLEQNPAIFLHETMHVQSRHYVDLFLFRIIQIIWWWNPLVWLMRTELGLLHEYEADEKVINHGIDATQYQLLLVRKAVGEQRFSLASGFQHAKLKNRITMMLIPTTNARMRFSYLALIPLLAIFVYACNPTKNNKVPAPAAADETEAPAVENQKAEPAVEIRTMESDEINCDTPDSGEEIIPFQLVETKPTFQGGDAGDFSKWVNSQLVYPDKAKEEKIAGRVVLQFKVDTDGAVRDVKVLRSAHEMLDAEAVRVISASPKWEPGRQKGEPVAVTYTFPVIFQLR